jgi:DNA invertase Pin-like site-specific DNA recombinase
MLSEARQHKFDIVLVWALDRFSREGILNTLSYLKTLKQHNVALKSLQESWLDIRYEGIGELLIAIFSWVANQEKKRISERIKAGLKGKKNVGKRGKDKGKRRKSGYYLRWKKT